MKLLSIAIASYNMELLLDKCLEPLTDPIVPDTVEVIVVNDGSKDRTLGIARVYEKMFPNIVRVVDKPNGNYGTCINKALELATGKFFRPVDADDWVDTRALVNLLQKLENCEADLVLTGFSRIFKKKVIKQMPSTISPNIIYDANTFNFKENGLENFISMHNMTYRTSILRDIDMHLSEGISFTDTQYCMLPISKIQKIIFYDLDLYQYNMGRDGQSMQKSMLARSIKAFYKLSMSLSQYYIDNNHNNSVVRDNQRCFIRRVLYYFYTSALVFGKNTAEEQSMLRNVTSLIIVNKELERDVMGFHYKGIPFVYIWKHFNCFFFKYFPKE